VPWSQVLARRHDVDLRAEGNGTVSGTALYQVAGFVPLATAGSLDVAKGAFGPLVAGRSRPALSALAASAAVTGHNWSPFLRGAGGRGVAPALGALLAGAPAGVAVVAAGLAGGRLRRQTGLGCFVAYVALVPIVRRVHGRAAAVLATSVLAPLLAKRIAGNHAPPAWDGRTVLSRLLLDRDPVPVRSDASERSERPATACVAGERKMRRVDASEDARERSASGVSVQERPAWPGNAK
jgi:glycerol-3-phosphate acyltransferase PlsY